MSDMTIFRQVGCGCVVRLGRNQSVHRIACSKFRVERATELAVTSRASFFGLRFTVKAVHEVLRSWFIALPYTTRRFVARTSAEGIGSVQAGTALYASAQCLSSRRHTKRNMLQIAHERQPALDGALSAIRPSSRIVAVAVSCAFESRVYRRSHHDNRGFT
jgi:hypothetical protein